MQSKQSVADSTLREKDKADTPISPNGNVPTTSAGKDTQISNNEQGSSVKNQETHQGGTEAESRADDLQAGSNDGVQEVHVGLNDNEAEEFLSRMEANAVPMPQLKLTQQAWGEQFGDDGKVTTPVGSVKVGANQMAKIFFEGSSEKFGMLRPTLTEPLAIIEVPSEATDGNTERATSLLFVKTFVGKNGEKVYYFKSVTVKKDGMEVSVSSHYDRPKRIKEALKTGKLLYRFDGVAQTEQRPADVSVTASQEDVQGISTDKDKQSSATKQANKRKSTESNAVSEDLFATAERVAVEDEAKRTRKKEEAKVDTNPTEAQKEAGNYRKGHIKVDGMDVTIEQPKGSVRRGKDADGKEWKSEMHNTYGYIRGTEGVDGDHIDIFLSDNPNAGSVFVVDQVKNDGSFDEHKVMYGFADMESAKQAYLSNYKEGWQGLGNITEVSKEDFRKWIDSSKRKTKPFAEYSAYAKETPNAKDKPKDSNRLVSDERMEELKKRLREKLRGQLNMGIDPELLAIGTEIAVGHIERGVSKFSEYAKTMIEDLGDTIRPYLKAFYNGARDMPELGELADQLTPYEEVRTFNVATIGEEGEEVKPTILQQAEQISNEHQVEQKTKEEAKQTSETTDVDNELYSITKQHNNKKDVDIWVVRGKGRVERDVFLQQKQAAKQTNGYYSSFRGVNGFVFTTPEEAQLFADNAFIKQQQDQQGNPINEDGTLKVEKVNTIDEITDIDFDNPTRNVELPTLPQNVDEAIGANGKPIVIKKNIFEKNKQSHSDLTPCTKS